MKKILPTNENQILLYYFPNCIDIIEIDLLSTQRPSKTLLMACFLLQASRRMIHSFEYIFHHYHKLVQPSDYMGSRIWSFQSFQSFVMQESIKGRFNSFCRLSVKFQIYQICSDSTIDVSIQSHLVLKTSTLSNTFVGRRLCM